MPTPEPIVTEALGLYSLIRPQAALIRHNENMTYRVTDADKKYVLRIHKRVEGFTLGIFDVRYSPRELVQSELDYITMLKNGTDLPMQTPVYGTNDRAIQTLADGTPVTLLEWVEGQTVESIGITPELSKDSGKLMAIMHTFFSKQKSTEKRCARYHYDQTILPQIANRIESAARLKAITQEQARIIRSALDETRRRFDELDNIHEKHLVHADLGKSNVIVGTAGRLTPIDFSLCGYSHFYMDIGGIFGLNHNDVNRKYIIEGYQSVRNCEINPRYVEPYCSLGVLLFITCQYERVKAWDWFPDNMKRWCRDIFQPLADNTSFLTKYN